MYRLIKKLFTDGLLFEVEEFLENDSALNAVFVFRERSLPYGGMNEIWLARTQSGNSVCFGRDTDKNMKKTKSTLIDGSFSNLLKHLDVNDFWVFKNDLGEAKDGVHYEFAFVGDNKKRRISIWNPKVDSKGFNLVFETKEIFIDLGVVFHNLG